MFEKQFDDFRVEVRARAAQQDRARLFARHAATIRAVFAHRVEAIDDGEDARRPRDRLAAQAVRVAEAVPALVMVADDGHDRVREIDAFEYLRADGRVNLHLVKLGGRQLPRLVQDVIGDGELADVVQQRAGLQRLDLVRAKGRGCRPSRAA